MPSRRSFLLSAAAGAVAAPLAAAGATPVPRAPAPPFGAGAGRALRAAAAVAGVRPPEALADDEAYWGEIQRAFDADRTMINLNNGGVSPTPTHVLEAMIRDLRFSNELPVEHMWRVLEPRIESVRRELAAEFGCDPEEMAITRNASEANETMILGLDLRRGDEVVVTTQNYPRMLTTWEQRARRDGVVVRAVKFDVPSTDAHVFERVTAAVTPRTRAIELPHITNLTGQVLPIRRLQDFARARGIALLVDGAHAFAHFPFTRDALDCDYYGTSLHKWLLAPVGTGFLSVRRERIPSLWPLMAAPKSMDADVRKYEEIGTHPAANHNAVAAALAFHQAIGAERKAARLRWLRDRWARALLAASDRVRVLTPLDDPARAGAIGFFSVEGLDPGKLGAWLLAKHHVVTTPIVFAEFSGIRITPNVYTTRREVDTFVELVARAIRTGVA
jgi:selenocysteine lyase/cysteine desulfurase